MSATRTVVPAAAAPATTWSETSPKRTRRPVKGRRVPSVRSSEVSRLLRVDLLDRLLGDDEHGLRDRSEQKLRPVGLALRDRPEEELLQVGRLARLLGDDHVREGRDRIRVEVLLRRV